MLADHVWIFWTSIKTCKAWFLFKFHELTVQNIVETKCDMSVYYSKFKHRSIGFILTNMDSYLESFLGNRSLLNLSIPMQIVSNQMLQCERSLKDQTPWRNCTSDQKMNFQRSNSGFVMRTYRKCKFEFYFFIHLLVTLWLYFSAAPSFSIKLHILNTDALSYMSSKHNCQKRFPPGKGYIANCYFSLSVVLLSLSVLVVLWLALLLQQSGDVHPNPGSSSVYSDTSSASAASILISFDFAKHLSFVHYNVQSVFPKLDVLFAELCDLDILAFSETWLNSSITNDDLLLQLYHSPERKD